VTIEEMRQRKRELGYTNQMIAEHSGIPLSTVQKVFAGATSSPRRETIEALERVLEKDKSAVYGDPVTSDRMVCETSAAYNVSAEDGNSSDTENRLYTLEDYLRLPDDQRVELIDGVFYDMAAPTTIHQSIAGFLHKEFLDFVMANKGPCFPFISPVDVQLDCDDKTVVQPDVLVVCDRTKYKNGRVFGAPDLVVEVLSPSTRRKDMQLKMYKYAGAGVREYWMVDPDKKLVVQYDLEHLGIPAIYNFQSVIPVLIWDGACTIDLREMDETIGFLWEL
jgi:Uma2 family endonuclease